MRTLAVGDIHGCFRALSTLAAYVPFQPDDLLITLGDYVDRGPDTHAVIDWLIHRSQTAQLVPLRGNHEIMLLNARESDEDFETWLGYGGDKVLASYSPVGDPGQLTDIPERHWEFVEGTRNFYETWDHFFVHANAYPDMQLADQPDFMLFWEKFNQPLPHENGKVMVCGHSAQRSGRPLGVGHAVCIDTWVYGDGWLTCLDIGSGVCWQANEQGETRQFQLTPEEFRPARM
jgi:serine/threonine protein phosphatase 1